MKNACWRVAAAGLALMAGAARAEENVAPDGWISLFDGKTLKGWKVSENPDQWKVDAGRIVAAGPRSHLFYMGDDENNPFQVGDFHFRADVMTTPVSNSGVYFHTRYQAVGFPQIGFECQVNNSHTDPVKTGSIYHIVKNFVPPSGDNYWFTLEIVVKGRNIRTLVNGKVISDYTEPPGVTGPMEKVAQGTFAFQAHDPRSTTYYKNIFLKK